MSNSILRPTSPQSPVDMPTIASPSQEHVYFISFLVLAIIGTLMIALGAINLDIPHDWIPLAYPVPTILIAIGVISMLGASGGCACLCLHQSTSIVTPTTIPSKPSTRLDSRPNLPSTPKNLQVIQAGNTHEPETGPLELILEFAQQLDLSFETQEHLKYFVEGILGTQKWFARHSENSEKFNLLLRQFTEVLSLIEQKDNTENTLLRTFLCELDIAYSDNKVSDDTAFSPCFAALSKLLLNWIRILQKPDTQEIKTALPFFFEEFKIHAIEMMVLDQRDLHVLTQSGMGEFFGIFESAKRLLILKRIYPELHKLPMSHSPSTVNEWPSQRILELKIIFPMKNNETADQYAQRVCRLGQVPLQVLEWPMHDSNKFSLATELLKEVLKISHNDLAVHDKESLSESSLKIAPLLESLKSYYCTKDLFVDYVKTWIEDASATQLHQKALNYVWAQSEEDHLFTPDKRHLSTTGISFLIQSLQKEGHFSSAPFTWWAELQKQND